MNPPNLFRCLAWMGILMLCAILWILLDVDPNGRNALTSESADLTRKKAVEADGLASLGDETRGHKPRSIPNDPNLIRLEPGQVLAMVNEEPIETRHLVPIPEEDSENVMTREEYASRLRRAVDMEIILQAALAEKVELTDAQKMRVESIAEENQEELDHYKKFGLSWRSTGSEHVEFERRLLNAQMLEQNLVTKKADVGPSTDPQIQSRYEQARAELLTRLHEQAEISFVTKITGK